MLHQADPVKGTPSLHQGGHDGVAHVAADAPGQGVEARGVGGPAIVDGAERRRRQGNEEKSVSRPQNEKRIEDVPETDI